MCLIWHLMSEVKSLWSRVIDRTEVPNLYQLFPSWCHRSSAPPVAVFTPSKSEHPNHPKSPPDIQACSSAGATCPGGNSWTSCLPADTSIFRGGAGGAVPWHAGMRGDGAHRKLVMCWWGFHFAPGCRGRLLPSIQPCSGFIFTLLGSPGHLSLLSLPVAFLELRLTGAGPGMGQGAFWGPGAL